MEILEFFGFVILFAVFVTVWTLPITYAQKVGHKNTTAIAVLTLLAGWTVIGWIVAMIWAVKKD
jgi:hypothetical protein